MFVIQSKWSQFTICTHTFLHSHCCTENPINRRNEGQRDQRIPHQLLFELRWHTSEQNQQMSAAGKRANGRIRGRDHRYQVSRESSRLDASHSDLSRRSERIDDRRGDNAVRLRLRTSASRQITGVQQQWRFALRHLRVRRNAYRQVV